VFLADKVSASEIKSSTIANNVFTSISDDAYAFIGALRNTTVNNFDKSDSVSSTIETNSEGFFEFWISDKETPYPDFGYVYSQQFTIA